MARLSRRPEEVGKLRQARTGHAAGEEAPSERDRVDDGRRDARAGQPLGLPVEEREVEPGVVRDEHGVAACELEEPPYGEGRRRGGTQLRVPQPGQRRGGGGHRHPGIDQRLELLRELEPADAYCADLADLGRAGPEPGRLEIDDDVRRVLEREPVAGRSGEGHRVAVPREAGVGLDHLREQRARERDRRLPQGEQPPRRLVGDDGAAPLLDELHEPVGGV